MTLRNVVIVIIATSGVQNVAPLVWPTLQPGSAPTFVVLLTVMAALDRIIR